MATRRMARRQSLIGNLTDVQRRLRFLESQPTKYRLASQVVRRTNVQPKAISTDQLADSSITNAIIADNSITSEKIGANEVTNTNIGNDAVTDRNIAPDSIDSSMIKNGEVQTEDLDDLAVTTAKIDNDAVTNAKIADSAVERAQIKDGEVVNSKLGEGAVTTSKILDGQVSTAKIGNLQVTTDKIGNGQVTSAKIGGLEVKTANIDNDAITTVKIRDGQVSSAKIGQGQVRTNNIDTQAVTNVKIAEGTIARNRLSFTPTETVRAGNGLSGGGTGRDLTLSVNFGSVATAGHTHNQYAPVNHPHPHTHPLSGTTNSGGAAPNQAHTHFYGTNTGQPSSLRYKKDITNYSFDVSKLLDTNLVSFKYLNQYKDKKANRELFYGYIAEDVAASGFEEILCYDENGQPNAVNYSLVGVLTLELVKMQEKRIKELENKIAEMSGDND